MPFPRLNITALKGNICCTAGLAVTSERPIFGGITTGIVTDGARSSRTSHSKNCGVKIETDFCQS